MGDRSGGATALLGMHGFVVLSQVETAGVKPSQTVLCLHL